MKALLTLSLILIYATATSQVLPTNAQVFNFAVGDTFVYQMAENSVFFEMMVVIARYDGGDSTIYTLQHHFNYDSTHNYLNHNIVHQIITQDSSAYSRSSFPNSYYPVPLNSCVHFLGGNFGIGPSSWSDSTIYWGAECVGGGSGTYEAYAAIGLGMVYINCSSYGAYGTLREYCNLVYYHLTNGDTGGVANYYILGVSDLASSIALIQLVPNPANRQFEVRTGQSLPDNTSFALFDAAGEILLSQKLASNNTMIQSQNISSGIYFWRVEVSGKTVRAGKVVLE